MIGIGLKNGTLPQSTVFPLPTQHRGGDHIATGEAILFQCRFAYLSVRQFDLRSVERKKLASLRPSTDPSPRSDYAQRSVALGCINNGVLKSVEA
jgi:hypothetical protein